MTNMRVTLTNAPLGFPKVLYRNFHVDILQDAHVKIGPFLAVLALQLLLTSGARAAGYFLPAIALGPTIGTTGIGVQVAVPLVPGRLNLNSGFSAFGLSHNITADGTTFHGKLRIEDVPLFLSVYPFVSSFHLDAGIYINENRVSAAAVAPANTSFSINGQHYGAAEIGSLYGRTRFNPVAPYVGFGFGNPFRGGPLTFTFNAGVMFEGGADIHLAASNPAILQIPGAASDIQAEQRSLNHDASFVRFFPVVNLGIVYRFG